MKDANSGDLLQHLRTPKRAAWEANLGLAQEILAAKVHHILQSCGIIVIVNCSVLYQIPVTRKVEQCAA